MNGKVKVSHAEEIITKEWQINRLSDFKNLLYG